VKRLIIPLMALAALGLAVVGVGATFAQQDGGSASTFLAKVAAKLGISEDKLSTAVDQAYDETIDEQVAAGQLTQEQADALKARGFDFAPGFGLGFGPGFGERGPMGGVRIMDAAATVLGLSTDDLMTQLRDGKSLADIAAAQGMSTDELTSNLLGQVKAQLDSLVSEGKLTQDQADNMYAQTESNIDQIVSDTSGFIGGCGRPHGGGGPGPMLAPSASPAPGSTAESTQGL
jgi:uncharacterized protein YidB (DUF937 family)